MTKQRLSFLFPLLCLILSLFFPQVCAKGVEKGLEICLKRALPALFPSLVLSSLLPKFWPRTRNAALFLPLFLGLFCGFPMGAVAVGEMVKKGTLSTADGEKMLLFCNNAGPAFFLSYCGGQILGDTKSALFLYLAQSVLAIGLFFLLMGSKIRDKQGETLPEKSISFGIALTGALKSASFSFLYIMSCVIFFSFLGELIHIWLSSGTLTILISLFLEITGGMEGLRALDKESAIALCALGCGWGGLSVHLQTAGVLEDTGLRLSFHTLGRAIFALLLFLFSLFFTKLL